MKATDITYRSLLVNYNRFNVPPFQRTYTWKTKNIYNLWESLLENKVGHYMGTVVCIQSESAGHRLDVIDGQQRLTTLSLIALAIRDFLKKNKQEKKTEDFQNILYFRDNLSNIFEPRIHFYKSNINNIYTDLLEGKDPSEHLDGNQKKLVNNYRTIYKLVKEYLKDGDVVGLKEKIENINFVLILSASDSDAYKLFEGLNSTGLPLTEVDLVKNSILKNVADKAGKNHKLLDTAEEHWNAMEAEFEEFNINLFGRFLRHNWISENGYITGSALFESIRKKYLTSSDAKAALDYVKDLNDHASTYISLRRADPELFGDSKGAALVDVLKKFELLGVDQAYELILSAHKRYTNDKKFTLKQYEQLLAALWSFSFIARYSTLSPASYERIYAEFAEKLYSFKGKDVYKDVVVRYLSKLKPLAKDHEAEFARIFVDECRYPADSPLIRILFQELFHQDDAVINQKDPSVEHILPQDPKEWGLKKENIVSFVNSIGNLTLLSQKENHLAQSHNMGRKVREVFSKSPFKMNKELKKWQKAFEDDPNNAITERGKEIAEKLYRLNLK